jgi:hypothetical protein
MNITQNNHLSNSANKRIINYIHAHNLNASAQPMFAHIATISVSLPWTDAPLATTVSPLYGGL